MESLIVFVYNIVLIVIYTCTAMYFGTLFIHEHKKSYLAASILFLLYIFDNIVVYMAEFIHSFSNYYDKEMSSGSVYKTLLLTGVCLCYLYIKTDFMGRKKPSPQDWGIYTAVVLCILFTSTTTSIINVWIYYIAESIFIIYLCSFLLIHCFRNHKNECSITENIYPFRYFLILIILLSTAVIIEDAVVLLDLSPIAAMSKRIRQRNACEDVLSLVFVVFAFYVHFYLKNKAKQHKQDNKHLSNEQSQEKHLKETISIPYIPIDKLDLNGFSSKYNLTKREVQVLKLLLEDKSNQEIQKILVIAPGTVKNHIHNIYQKTNVSKRSQLLNLVCEFTMQ